MKFNTHKILNRSIPQPGSKKTKKRFAIFPVKIDRQYIWLESYIVEYRFKQYDDEEIKWALTDADDYEYLDLLRKGWRITKYYSKQP